ncbi:MAG: DUF1697 domain-containing protein [Rhizobiales bacterium]|nr:DUF1697 domain-containing protein [Hyphomicrobiales bacterium]MBN9010041.1 DUF1697 domain-containing protein [Hyphomicrobiales bacterium]
MASYVALLYSIVLPGNARLKMEALRDLAARAGFADARTIGASGNLILDAKGRPSVATIERKLEAEFVTAFGKPVPIIVRPAAALRAMPARNPFGSAHHPQRVSVRVMRAPYPPAILDDLAPYIEDEDVALVDGDLWIGFRRQPSETRLLSAFSTRRFASRPGTFRALSVIERIGKALG